MTQNNKKYYRKLQDVKIRAMIVEVHFKDGSIQAPTVPCDSTWEEVMLMLDDLYGIDNYEYFLTI